MKFAYALPLVLSGSLALLGACSKPADPAVQSTPSAVADSAMATTSSATAPGGAVSPPAANGAVNADANTGSTDVAAASSSFTEAQARGHIEHAGYTKVMSLTKTADGLWTGKATKDGKTVDVSVDFKGAVTTQ